MFLIIREYTISEIKGEAKLHCLGLHFQHNFRLLYSDLGEFRCALNAYLYIINYKSEFSNNFRHF